MKSCDILGMLVGKLQGSRTLSIYDHSTRYAVDNICIRYIIHTPSLGFGLAVVLGESLTFFLAMVSFVNGRAGGDDVNDDQYFI